MCAVYFHRWLPLFWRNLLPPSSWKQRWFPSVKLRGITSRDTLTLILLQDADGCNILRVGYCTCDRQVWLCGEVVTVALKDRSTQLFPHIQLLNLYSISECHDIACSGKLTIIVCLAALGLTVSLLCIMTSSLVQVRPSGRPSSLRFPSVPLCQGVRLSFSQNCC